MRLFRTMRRQKAIYWRRGAVDRYGRYTFDDPIEIDVRWDDGIQEVRTPQGQLVTFNAIVYVDREMALGDMLKRGELDSNTVDDPKTDDEAKTIQRFEQIPNLRATATLFIAYV